jgi:hypothetical protein
MTIRFLIALALACLLMVMLALWEARPRIVALTPPTAQWSTGSSKTSILPAQPTPGP